MRAALLHEYGEPFDVIDDVSVVEPSAGQVLVKIEYCGICRTDLHMGGGVTPLPLIAGHEAAGRVESIGAGVVDLAVGDPVVLTPTPSCGRCQRCLDGHPTVCAKSANWMTGELPDGTVPFRWNDQPVYRGSGVGAWAEYTIVSDDGAIRIDGDIPLNIACLIGCAVQTGVGAVLNSAGVEPGSSVLVLGAGGVGQSVVQGARIAGASQIVVSDPLAERRDLACELGATQALDPTNDDVLSTMREVGGVDYVFDAAGSSSLVELGARAVKPGGTVVLIGVPSPGDHFDSRLHTQLVVQEKRLVGSLAGSGNARKEFPRLLSLWRSGALDLTTMVSAEIGLEEVNQGIASLKSGQGIRTVIALS